ncbi:VgrG-related protein [Coleofasciculus chthonoplastes]|uniref:VgrG-related protein n=1 Tax=Coleofasciculus chthonoplastes TaxID=64178 RepID=UPI0032F17DF0
MGTPTYVAQLLLEIEGQLAPPSLMEDILEVCVEESLHLPGMFTLIINNPYFPGSRTDQTWQHQDLFAFGKWVKIGFISSTAATPEFAQQKQGYVLEGEITAMETHFSDTSQAPIIIRGYDVSHRLHRGRYNRSFQNMTDSDIIKKIAGEVGIQLGTIDESNIPHDYVFQENQTNIEFFQERAARLGFELFVQDGKLYFRKPQVGKRLSLKWLKQIHQFQVRVTSREQVSEVEVRGWDYRQKQAIVSTATAPQVLTQTDFGQGCKTSQTFHGQPPSPKMIVVDQPMFQAKEAEVMAQAICDQLAGEFVQADARGEGNPEIRPGRVVQLEGMGKYSGEYYITETRHLLQDRVYITEFTVSSLRGENLCTLFSPRTHPEPGQTLLVGIVTNNKDPENMGRVRVKFPTLTEEHESNWARVVGHGIGNNRGNDCLPEVNDEVVVGFEHGDIHRPYILGGVWNGKDKPPEHINDTVSNGNVRLRTFATPSGHKLQFAESPKGGVNPGISLTSSGGNSFSMDDMAKKMESATPGGCKVSLDDIAQQVLVKAKNVVIGKATDYVLGKAAKLINFFCPGLIQLKSTDVTLSTLGGHQVRLSDKNNSITLKSIGKIKLEGLAGVEIVSPRDIVVKSGGNIYLNRS